MDEELKELALLALKSAFYKQFSALVNTYLAAAEGLNYSRPFERALGDMANVFSRDDDAKGEEGLNIWTRHEDRTCGWDTMAQALEAEGADEVWLCGRKVFQREGSEWFFVEHTK